jgi:hypothetical protein
MSKKEESNHHGNDPPAAAAAKPPAATSSSSSSSSSIAEALYAVETLVQVFGFSVEASNQAVNEVGADVTSCYNYILDQGLGKDTGGAVYPIDHCPHIRTHVTTTKYQLADQNLFQEFCQYHSLAKKKKQSSTSETTGKLKEATIATAAADGESTPSCPKGENWLCLACNRVLCSRYVNGHGLQHWKDTCQQKEGEEDAVTGHCVAVSLADLSVWCHVCSAYLVHDEDILKPIVVQLEQLKFADEKGEGRSG